MILGLYNFGLDTFANIRSTVVIDDRPWKRLSPAEGDYTEVAKPTGVWTKVDIPAGTYTKIGGS